MDEDGSGSAIHADEQPRLSARKESDKNTENSECPQPQTRIWMRREYEDSDLVIDRAVPAIYAGEQPQTSHEEISDTNTENSKCPQINFTEVTI